MQKTDAELINEANVIKNETERGANTAQRIGDMIVNIVDSKVNNEAIVENTVVYNLGSVPYIMETVGIFEFSNCTQTITFPDPTLFNGKKITIINVDRYNNINIASTLPFWLGSDSEISVLGTYSMFNFVSINNKWRGGYLLD
jgi:hypothetical protein